MEAHGSTEFRSLGYHRRSYCHEPERRDRLRGECMTEFLSGPEWRTKCLEEMSARNVKRGATRSDLLEVFKPAGGLSSRSMGTFAYRSYPYVEVDVTFDVKEDKSARDSGD